MGATLGIYALPWARQHPEITSDCDDWLRVLAAFVACGDTPRIVVLPGSRLDEEVFLSDLAQRTLDTLETFGVVPEPVDAADLIDAVAESTRIICVSAGAHDHDLLVVDDAEVRAARADPSAFLERLRDAGQVIRIR